MAEPWIIVWVTCEHSSAHIRWIGNFHHASRWNFLHPILKVSGLTLNSPYKAESWHDELLVLFVWHLLPHLWYHWKRRSHDVMSCLLCLFDTSCHTCGIIGKPLMSRGARSQVNNISIYGEEVIEHWTIFSLKIHSNKN